MTISRKNRRRIVVGVTEYLWYVAPDHDAFDGPVLTVVSTDRKFFVRYPLLQSDNTRHVVVLGSRFRGLQTGGPWRRFRCPSFGTLETVAPHDVRLLIECSLATGDPPQEVAS